MPARMQPYQMSLMPVMRVGVLPVIIPFLEIALAANLIWSQPGQHRVGQGNHPKVAKRSSGITAIPYAFSSNGQIRCSTVGKTAIEAVRCNVMILR